MRDLSILQFDEPTHLYFVGGRAALSVTKILEVAGITDFSSVNKDLLDRASKFGQAVHRGTELHDLGTLDKSSLDAPLVPYLEAWKKFCAKEISEFIEIEVPVWSKRFGFAGKPDRVALDKRKRLILPDIKSSKALAVSVKLQTAGYQIAWEELEGPRKIARRIGVLLQETGEYYSEEYSDRSDRDDFIACARVAAFKLRNGSGHV
jgi:hypothetical protein